MKDISIVIPCYNEELIIADFHERLTSVLKIDTNFNYKIIYINDGSSDKTEEILKKFYDKDKRVNIISFTRNFGHQNALFAGLEHSLSDATITIDADLQDPPELIPELLKIWKNGIDIVYAVRTERKGESLFKKITAKIFYNLINKLSDFNIPLNTGDFRLMDKKVVSLLTSFPEKNKYFRGLSVWTGFSQAPCYFIREKRSKGETKYPLNKMIKFATDAIISFSDKPLRIISKIGFITFILSFIGIIYSLFRKFSGYAVEGYTLMFVSIMFLGGIQLLSLGLLGEYISRIFSEIKKRPDYIIKQKFGFDEKTN